GDLLFDFDDLRLYGPLLRGVVLERFLQLLLGGQRVSQVAAKLRTDLIDQGKLRLLWIRWVRVRVHSPRSGAEHDQCEGDGDQQPLHDSRCLRRLTSDEPEPRPRPAAQSSPAANAATVTVMPGANCAKLS